MASLSCSLETVTFDGNLVDSG